MPQLDASCLLLPVRYLQNLQRLLAQHTPTTEVWAYGSRVVGGAHEGSDLDLVLRHSADLEQDPDGWADLKKALQESNLPILVDMHLWPRLPVAFHRNIQAGYVVMQVGSDWKTESLSDLCEQIADCPHSTPLWTKSGAIVLRNQNIRGGQLNLSSPSYTNESHFEHRSRRARLTAGDLVLTREAPMGEVCLIPENLRCCLGQRMVMLRPNLAKCDPHFLLYAIQSPAVQHEIKVSEGTGSTISNLRIPLLEALKIQHPPLPQQSAIAHILGTLDDKIDLNRRMNETLEQMAQALFKSWFVDFDPVRAKMDGRWQRGESLPGLPADLFDLFPDRLMESELGEIPEGWSVKPANALIKFNPTESLRKGTLAPYLDMASLPTTGSWPDAPIVRAFGSGMRFRNRDTLLARITPCLENGKTAYVQCLADGEVAWGSTEYIVMRPLAPVPAEYAYLLAREPSFREHVIRSMTGTSGRQRAQGDSVAAFKVIAPNDKKLWQAFANLVSLAFSGIKTNSEASATLSTLRDTLLPKLISGELRLNQAEKLIGDAT